MIDLSRARTTPWLIAVAAGALAAVPLRGAPADLVLDHVTVVDTASGALLRDRAVVVAGGTIVRVVPGGHTPGGHVVDLRGKYVVPGFNDMHAHPLNQGGAAGRDDLRLLLANGVTGFRQMSGSADLLRARAAGTLLPPGPIPALLAMPGDVLIRPVAPTPAAGVAAVDAQKAQGADFIKVVDVSPPVFFAVAAEAKKVGLPVLGHLPTGVDAAKASAAGYRSIEHLGPFEVAMLSCSTDEAAIRAAMAAAPPPPMPAMAPAKALAMLEDAATEPLLLRLAIPGLFPLLDRVAATYDPAKCAAFAKVLITNGTWMSPTLIRDRTIVFGDDPAYVNDPDLRYVAPAQRAKWAAVAARLMAALTPAQRATLGRFWTAQLRFLKDLDAAGVPMIAGSDLGGQWDIAGFSLHHDFDLLAADGLTPLKVLQMTTLDAARFLGREATMGRVAAGQAADLVVLDGNPVADVANLHRIAAVVRAGGYLGRADLDAILTGIAAKNAAPATP